MAKCEICNDYDDNHIDNMSEGNDAQDKAMEENPHYKPNLYFYWHGDIEEDYDMGNYDCLCVGCFTQQDMEGKIKWKENQHGKT